MKTIYVKAKGFDDPVLINEEDFDPAVHEKFDESDKSAKGSSRGKASQGAKDAA